MIDRLTQYYQKTHFFLMCCLVLFPITPKGVHSTIIIIITIVALSYFFIQGRKDWTTKKTKYVIALGSLFIIYCLSLLHRGDVNTGMKFVIRTAPVFLIPFSFLNQKTVEWDIKQLQRVLFIYIIAIGCVLFFLHYNFFEEIHHLQITSWEKRCRIEESIKVHGTYLSIWIGMAVISAQWIVFQNKRHKKLFIIFGILVMGYFLFWQYFLGARMPLFATLVASSFLLLTSFKIPFKIILGSYVFLFAIGLLIFWNPVRAKMQELSNYQTAIPEGKYENTNTRISNENIRSAIYHCAISNIKEKPLLGYGVGNVNRAMQYCYNQNFEHTDLFRSFHFNAHSQYLQVILSAGLFGLIVFLASIFLWLQWSRQAITLYLPFLLLVLLSFIFENIVSRHDGIVFFSVFNTILLFVNPQKDTLMGSK